MPGYVPAPATKGAELIERLNAIALGAEVDDLVLRRIGHDAKKMMAADPAAAHTVLGAVAVLDGRADDVRTHFRIALQQSGNSAWVSRNYSRTLLILGETAEALEMARQASRRAPDDLAALGELIEAALQAGHFREARTLEERFSKLSPDRPLPDESVAQMLGDAVDRGAFREESVQEVLRVVQEILRTERVRRIGRSTMTADVTYPDSFFFKIYIFASAERAVELNEVLASRITDQPDLMADPGTMFVPMFIGVRANGGHSARAS